MKRPFSTQTDGPVGEQPPVAERPAAPVDLSPLVQAAQGGDEEAMHELVLSVLPRVRNGVRYLVRDEVREDLVQDVLETVLRRLDSFRGEGRFEAWVDGVTLRVVLGKTRKLRADARRTEALETDEVAHLHGGESYATRRQLVHALDQLPDAQRQVLVMHHVFGLTAPEVAAQLKVRRETVRSRLRVGMGQLRALLRPRREMDDGE